MEYYPLKLSTNKLADPKYNTPGSWLVYAVNSVALVPREEVKDLCTTYQHERTFLDRRWLYILIRCVRGDRTRSESILAYESPNEESSLGLLALVSK